MLHELGLKWNFITAVGGNEIAQVLESNKHLKILDLSWNQIGVLPSVPRNAAKLKLTPMKQGDIGAAWGRALAINKSLIHLDLSFNKIDEKETLQIANDLVYNKTLVGFHFQGNYQRNDEQVGRVDSMGYLIMQDKFKNNPRDAHMMNSIPDGSPTKKQALSYMQSPSKMMAADRDFGTESGYSQGTFVGD